MLFVGCSLCSVLRLLFAVCSAFVLLFVGRRLLFWRVLFVECCVLFAVSHVQIVVCCYCVCFLRALSCVACCMLVVVCCSLSDVCCVVSIVWYVLFVLAFERSSFCVVGCLSLVCCEVDVCVFVVRVRVRLFACLFAVCCGVLIVRCALCVVRRVLFVDCCVLMVALHV